MDMKSFLISLYDVATSWSQEAKKLLPVATRGALKKSVIQYKIDDVKHVHSDKITQYIEVKLLLLLYFHYYIIITD